jgi:hypothetical protein
MSATSFTALGPDGQGHPEPLRSERFTPTRSGSLHNNWNKPRGPLTSYCDDIGGGMVADREQTPDIDEFPCSLDEEVETLSLAAGITSGG